MAYNNNLPLAIVLWIVYLFTAGDMGPQLCQISLCLQSPWGRMETQSACMAFGTTCELGPSIFFQWASHPQGVFLVDLPSG